MKRLLLSIVLLISIMSLSAFILRPHQSVCTLTGLTGAALQENDLYCPVNPSPSWCNSTDTNAPSTYPEAIQLAAAKSIIVGTPCQVSTVHDWKGNLRVDVEFTRGYHAEHYLSSSDHTVWIYDPFDRQVWP